MNVTKRVALWAPGNPTPQSSVFCVAPGQAVILSASGFDCYAMQEEDEFKTEMTACVERVLFDFSQTQWNDMARRCDWVVDPSRRLAEEISAETVSVGECEWTLSLDRNLAAIGVPGNYRLVLNDETAVGTAQVYAEVVGIDQIRPSSVFFGSE